MCVDCRLVMTSGALLAAGALLIAVAHRLRGSNPAARRMDWIKYGVYFALIGLLLALGAAGRPYAATFFCVIAAGGRGTATSGPFPSIIVSPALCAGMCGTLVTVPLTITW